MNKVKELLNKGINKIKSFDYKRYASTNKQVIAFIISSLINAILLRFFTVHNYFAIKPILADLGG